jgi:predicted anti-sigma-YlaC factor YlaD
MSCKELVELVTEYLEGTLPADDRVRFEAHLGECEGCENYLGQMRLTISTLGALSEETIPPEARDNLLEAFRSWKG